MAITAREQSLLEKIARAEALFRWLMSDMRDMNITW